MKLRSGDDDSTSLNIIYNGILPLTIGEFEASKTFIGDNNFSINKNDNLVIVGGKASGKTKLEQHIYEKIKESIKQETLTKYDVIRINQTKLKEKSRQLEDDIEFRAMSKGQQKRVSISQVIFDLKGNIERNKSIGLETIIIFNLPSSSTVMFLKNIQHLDATTVHFMNLKDVLTNVDKLVRFNNKFIFLKDIYAKERHSRLIYEDDIEATLDEQNSKFITNIKSEYILKVTNVNASLLARLRRYIINTKFGNDHMDYISLFPNLSNLDSSLFDKKFNSKIDHLAELYIERKVKIMTIREKLEEIVSDMSELLHINPNFRNVGTPRDIDSLLLGKKIISNMIKDVRNDKFSLARRKFQQKSKMRGLMETSTSNSDVYVPHEEEVKQKFNGRDSSRRLEEIQKMTNDLTHKRMEFLDRIKMVKKEFEISKSSDNLINKAQQFGFKAEMKAYENTMRLYQNQIAKIENELQLLIGKKDYLRRASQASFNLAPNVKYHGIKDNFKSKSINSSLALIISDINENNQKSSKCVKELSLQISSIFNNGKGRSRGIINAKINCSSRVKRGDIMRTILTHTGESLLLGEGKSLEELQRMGRIGKVYSKIEKDGMTGDLSISSDLTNDENKLIKSHLESIERIGDVRIKIRIDQRIGLIKKAIIVNTNEKYLQYYNNTKNDKNTIILFHQYLNWNDAPNNYEYARNLLINSDALIIDCDGELDDENMVLALRHCRPEGTKNRGHFLFIEIDNTYGNEIQEHPFNRWRTWLRSSTDTSQQSYSAGLKDIIKYQHSDGNRTNKQETKKAELIQTTIKFTKYDWKEWQEIKHWKNHKFKCLNDELISFIAISTHEFDDRKNSELVKTLKQLDEEIYQNDWGGASQTIENMILKEKIQTEELEIKIENLISVMNDLKEICGYLNHGICNPLQSKEYVSEYNEAILLRLKLLCHSDNTAQWLKENPLDHFTEFMELIFLKTQKKSISLDEEKLKFISQEITSNWKKRVFSEFLHSDAGYRGGQLVHVKKVKGDRGKMKRSGNSRQSDLERRFQLELHEMKDTLELTLLASQIAEDNPLRGIRKLEEAIETGYFKGREIDRLRDTQRALFVSWNRETRSIYESQLSPLLTLKHNQINFVFNSDLKWDPDFEWKISHLKKLAENPISPFHREFLMADLWTILANEFELTNLSISQKSPDKLMENTWEILNISNEIWVYSILIELFEQGIIPAPTGEIIRTSSKTIKKWLKNYPWDIKHLLIAKKLLADLEKDSLQGRTPFELFKLNKSFVEEMNKLNFDTNKKTLKEIWKQDEETEDSLKKWFDKIKNN